MRDVKSENVIASALTVIQALDTKVSFILRLVAPRVDGVGAFTETDYFDYVKFDEGGFLHVDVTLVESIDPNKTFRVAIPSELLLASREELMAKYEVRPSATTTHAPDADTMFNPEEMYQEIERIVAKKFSNATK